MMQFFCRPMPNGPPVVQPTVATPTFSPVAGSYPTAQSVTISCSTPASNIFYTTDGTVPTTSSIHYTAPVSVSVSETLNAIATAVGFLQSAVGTAAYSIALPQAATPTFAPGAGTYASTQTVSISCSSPSSSIYYTLDGSTPTFPIAGTTALYAVPLTVGASETIKAIAVAAGFTNSAVGSAAYVIGTPSFDFFIAPNGDDNNPGTLASPWSITAFNIKMSTYSGKRVGIIGDIAGVKTPIQFGTVGGVQTTLYSMMQTINAGNQLAAIKVDGGTSGSPTYLGSCTSAGIYQGQWARLDASNPIGGAVPVGAFGIIIGQPFFSTTPVPHPGNITVDGLEVTNFNYAGMIFGDIQATVLNNVVIQNCKVFNGVCSTSNENPGGIFLGSCNAAQVLNCLIHDCSTTSGDIPGMAGITTYNTGAPTVSGLVVTNCTIYNCGYSVQQKDVHQWGTFSYNYFDNGNFGDGANRSQAWAIKGGIPGSGQTLTVHHNIIIGYGYDGFGEDLTKTNGTANFFNNTFYQPPAVITKGYCAWWQTSAGDGPFHWNNNLVYYPSGYGGAQASPGQNGQLGCLSWNQGAGLAPANVNGNYYGTGMTFGAGSSSAISFASWKALGFDLNSVTGANPFPTTPTALNISSFAITGPATTAGLGGTPCGALDGSGSIGSTLT